MQCTGLNLTSPLGQIILIFMSFLEILEQQCYTVLNLRTETIHQQGVCYGIRDSIRTGRANISLLSVSSVSPPSLSARGKPRLLSCLALSVGWGGAGPMWQQHQWLQGAACAATGLLSALLACAWAVAAAQVLQCVQDRVSALPHPHRRTCSSLRGHQAHTPEPGKGEKVCVDLEREEWEGILTESNICFIKNKMKTSA